MPSPQPSLGPVKRVRVRRNSRRVAPGSTSPSRSSTRSPWAAKTVAAEDRAGEGDAGRAKSGGGARVGNVSCSPAVAERPGRGCQGRRLRRRSSRSRPPPCAPSPATETREREGVVRWR